MSDILAPVVRHVIGPAWARWERSPYLREYRRLLRTQWESAEQIQERAWTRVRQIAQHAYQNTQFWRRRFDEAGMRPEDLRSPDDYRRIPPLTKHDLRTEGESLLAQGLERHDWHHHTTSGSTGHSVGVFVDEPAQQWRRACTLRSDEWSGWRFGERVAMVWGNPEYVKRGWRGRLRNTLLDRASYLDTLKLSQESLRAFVELQRRRRPMLIMGHAHSLYLLAQFCREYGGAGFAPRGIISTAMVLHDWQRQVIEEVFGTKVTNRYGCEEVSLIASQCERHTGLHVNADNIYLELVAADGSPARPGQPGSVLATDLSNRALPLLRYQVGDVAVWSEERCPCGRGLPMLARLEGREADYVTTPGGDLVSGISLTENFATQIPGVVQVQIIQERIDHFRFRLVRGERFGEESLAKIRHLVSERFGPGVDFVCEYVDAIQPEPSGKYRFCISRVENALTRRREPVCA